MCLQPCDQLERAVMVRLRVADEYVARHPSFPEQMQSLVEALAHTIEGADQRCDFLRAAPCEVLRRHISEAQTIRNPHDLAQRPHDHEVQHRVAHQKYRGKYRRQRNHVCLKCPARVRLRIVEGHRNYLSTHHFTRLPAKAVVAAVAGDEGSRSRGWGAMAGRTPGLVAEGPCQVHRFTHWSIADTHDL